MKEQIKMTYIPGRGIKSVFKNVSNDHLEAMRREIVKEQIRRRELRRQPKKVSKLRRFLRRLWLTYRHRIDVMCDAIVGTPSAAEIEYIGIEGGR